MTTILKKIRKTLGNGSALAALAVAALLSVVLGCGGTSNGNAASNNVVTMDLAGTLGADDSVSTIGMTIRNNSNASIVNVGYFNNTGVSVSKDMSPKVGPGQTIAVLVRVKVSKVTNSDVNGGTITSYTSTTNAITVTISSTSGSNYTITMGVGVNSSTGQLTLTPAGTEIVYTG